MRRHLSTNLKFKDQNDLIELDKKKNILNFSKLMSNVILIIVIFFFLIILVKLQHVFFYSPDLYNINKNFLQKNRGKIFDRNGELIATNIDTKDFYLDTRRVLDKDNLKIKLKKIFPYKNDTYFENIFSKKQYNKIKKYLTVNEQNQLKKIGSGIML